MEEVLIIPPMWASEGSAGCSCFQKTLDKDQATVNRCRQMDEVIRSKLRQILVQAMDTQTQKRIQGNTRWFCTELTHPKDASKRRKKRMRQPSTRQPSTGAPQLSVVIGVKLPLFLVCDEDQETSICRCLQMSVVILVKLRVVLVSPSVIQRRKWHGGRAHHSTKVGSGLFCWWLMSPLDT